MLKPSAYGTTQGQNKNCPVQWGTLITIASYGGSYDYAQMFIAANVFCTRYHLTTDRTWTEWKRVPLT